jgi:hypothetical protein
VIPVFRHGPPLECSPPSGPDPDLPTEKSENAAKTVSFRIAYQKSLAIKSAAA